MADVDDDIRLRAARVSRVGPSPESARLFHLSAAEVVEGEAHHPHFARGLAGLAKHKNVHLPPGTNEQNVWERICTLMNQLDQQGEGKGRAARRAPAYTPAEDDFAEAAGRGREYTASSPRNAPGELSLTEDIVRRAEVASAHARGLAGGKGAALPADAEAAADIAERAARASASVR